jgi:D-arabinose 1-dehydrogenase-like Zn-dependent alcohol dehydrogenase
MLMNKKLIGSTMGSHKDLLDATEFLSQHKIVPVVSHVLDGLDKFEEGFEIMRKGDQMGKIILKLGEDKE